MSQSYLPSKQFRARLVLILILVAIVLLITKVTPIIRNKLKKTSVEQSLLVTDMVAQDSNSNGIADWEEALWGLDPKGDGAENKAFIVSKKKNLEDGDPTNDGELSANDKLAREFFALVVSLKQNGNLNEQSIQNLSNLVGQKVVATPIEDAYTKDMMTTKATTSVSIKEYYTKFRALANNHKTNGIGDELGIISQILTKGDKESVANVKRIANEYRAFGQDLLQIPVPSSLADTQFKLANLYEKNAETIEGMAKMLENPIEGMSSLVRYKKYNDELIKTLEEMRTFFVRNGIINS